MESEKMGRDRRASLLDQAVHLAALHTRGNCGLWLDQN